jgi:hypothetical protein
MVFAFFHEETGYKAVYAGYASRHAGDALSFGGRLPLQLVDH